MRIKYKGGTLKNFISLLFAAMLLPTICFADQLLQYEPNVVEIKGSIHSGKFQHPNGTWVKYYYIKLLEPVSIKGDKANLINSSETGIKEIQIYSMDKGIIAKLKKVAGKKAIIKGTIFHEHTAWHVRKLVMKVSDLK
jgi:hypothetical protein